MSHSYDWHRLKKKDVLIIVSRSLFLQFQQKMELILDNIFQGDDWFLSTLLSIVVELFLIPIHEENHLYSSNMKMFPFQVIDTELYVASLKLL